MNEAVQRVFDWLVDGAPGAGAAPAVVERLGADLRAAGLPVDRVAAYVRTLHPHIAGRAFVWTPGAEVAIGELSWAMLHTPMFLASPVAEVVRTAAPLRARLDGPAPRAYAIYDELAGQGYTDVLAAPLRFLSGETHVITFATRAAGGFSDDDLAALHHVLRPLARIAEILALTRTATNLLSTYVGRDAGGRILAGKIQRGDTDTLRAVIWLSDLRGFTQLSTQMAPGELIAVLNDLFECQVPAIERRGGEVLKFIGDGLLAILPLEGAGRTAADACAAALAAADDAFRALAELNAQRAAPIRFGLALHVGDVSYGNIGGASRLDFTAIGPAVNLAARLEGLTSTLGEPVVLSAELVALAGLPARSLGRFTLKGVAEPVEVFAPAR